LIVLDDVPDAKGPLADGMAIGIVITAQVKAGV